MCCQAEAERDDFEGQLKAVAAQYNALAAKLRFATEEYGLKTSPVLLLALSHCSVSL